VARSASQAIAIDSLLRRPTVVALCGSTDSTPSVMIDARERSFEKMVSRAIASIDAYCD
jgi:hypothetical protein